MTMYVIITKDLQAQAEYSYAPKNKVSYVWIMTMYVIITKDEQPLKLIIAMVLKIKDS